MAAPRVCTSAMVWGWQSSDTKNLFRFAPFFRPLHLFFFIFFWGGRGRGEGVGGQVRRLLVFYEKKKNRNTSAATCYCDQFSVDTNHLKAFESCVIHRPTLVFTCKRTIISIRLLWMLYPPPTNRGGARAAVRLLQYHAARSVRDLLGL